MYVENSGNKETFLFFEFLGAFLRVLDLRNDYFENHRLAVWNERLLFARQCGEVGQLRSLHCSLDASQRMAANQDFVHGEDQPKFLLLAFALEFSERKLVVGQQQGMVCRDFNANTARLRVIRPTLG